jgi:hypothetical protein
VTIKSVEIDELVRSAGAVPVPKLAVAYTVAGHNSRKLSKEARAKLWPPITALILTRGCAAGGDEQRLGSITTSHPLPSST